MGGSGIKFSFEEEERPGGERPALLNATRAAFAAKKRF